MTSFETREAYEQIGLLSIQSLKQVWNDMMDLLFPPRCQHCGRVDSVFCETCIDDLLILPPATISSDISPMTAVISSGIHAGLLQSGVQALKYGGQRQLGAVFAKRLYSIVQKENWTFDTIIPVPLHTARLEKRGYNQAKEVSIHLAQLLNCQHCDDILIRQSRTRSQVGLNYQERMENVREVFQVTSTQLKGATVLLVDDVRTTGATMASCADVLLDNGLQAVYGITVSATERF